MRCECETRNCLACKGDCQEDAEVRLRNVQHGNPQWTDRNYCSNCAYELRQYEPEWVPLCDHAGCSNFVENEAKFCPKHNAEN